VGRWRIAGRGAGPVGARSGNIVGSAGPGGPAGLPMAFWWLWLGTLINKMGSFVLPLLAFYITGALHQSPALAGLVASLYGAGALVAGLVGGVLADLVGRKPTALAALTANAATILLLGYARSPWSLALAALAAGLASNAFMPASSAMVADMVRPADRVRAYALVFWAVNLGFSFSMLAVGAVVAFGYHALFIADAASTTFCAVLIAVMVRDTTPEAAAGVLPAHEAGMRAVLRDRVFVAFVAVLLVVMVVYAQVNVTQPMAMQRVGLSAVVYGRISAINGFLIVLFQMPMTRWLGRFAASRVLAVFGLLIGLGLAVQLFGHSIAIYVVAVTVLTVGEIGVSPIASAVVAQISPVHLRGRYQGLFQLSFSGAGIVGPLLGGAVFSAYGGTPVWLGCLALAALAGVAQLRIGSRVERRVTAAMKAEAAVSVLSVSPVPSGPSSPATPPRGRAGAAGALGRLNTAVWTLAGRAGLQVLERREVVGRLAALDPPGPLAADRRGEAEFEQGVEARIRGVEDRAEQPVHLVLGDRGQRDPTHQEHVAEPVEREGDPGQPGVALQQPAVDGLVVLVGRAHHEGVDRQGVVAQDQRAGGRELAHAGQFDHVVALARLLPLRLDVDERRLDRGRRGFPDRELAGRLPVAALPVGLIGSRRGHGLLLRRVLVGVVRVHTVTVLALRAASCRAETSE
jgi:MFS family permease